MTENREQAAQTHAANPQPVYSAYLPHSVQTEDEISLIDFWRLLWGQKRTIVVVTTLCTIAAVVYAIRSPVVYHTELTMVSAQQEGGGSELASRFGGLASLAGISLGGGSRAKGTETALATLRSRSFISNYIEQRNLKPLLFPGQWDADNNQWRAGKKASLMARAISGIKALILPQEKKTNTGSGDGSPSNLRAYEVLSKSMSVRKNEKTGLITLGIEWNDPTLAAVWANDLVAGLNKFMRKQAIQESDKSIRFLEQESNNTSFVDGQKALYALIEGQTQSKMLANVREEYAFKVIDPAVAPESRSKPKRTMIVMMGMVLGLLLGIFLAFVTNFVTNQRATLAQEDG